MTHTEKTIKNMEADVLKKETRIKAIDEQIKLLEIEKLWAVSAVVEMKQTIEKLKQ